MLRLPTRTLHTVSFFCSSITRRELDDVDDTAKIVDEFVIIDFRWRVISKAVILLEFLHSGAFKAHTKGTNHANHSKKNGLKAIQTNKFFFLVEIIV